MNDDLLAPPTAVREVNSRRVLTSAHSPNRPFALRCRGTEPHAFKAGR